MRLILVRHGATEWNQQRRVQGLSNLGLNETGKRQAEALAQALKDINVLAIYCSPLRRAQETALAISRFHQVKVVTLDGLKELDVGEVDGMTYDEMKTSHNEFFTRWMVDFTSVRLPGGGFVPELRDQCCAAIQGIVKENQPKSDAKGDGDDRVVVAVTHFFPIMCIICDSLGLDLSYCRRLRLDVASICTLDFNSDRTVLVSYNDTCHLRQGAK
jgi:broad specificity phosphatase PhoE